ncbi:MAG: FGGY-family carbohydrate kinase [Ardenticatenia bacterium]|nr:FGGY-family carbohydrate kinase [Ardenticatenia bacterium]
MAYLLGIDIGTTATKAVIIDTKGHILAEAFAPSTLMSPLPGWAEEDANEWWENVGTVCRDLLARGFSPDDIAAVGVSGMVPTIVLLDDQGHVLRPSIQQNDARAHVEITEFKAQTDEADILHRTGSAVTQQSIGPKLLWLWRHEPEVMERARKVLGSYDFINYRLTGVCSCEQNWALESGLFDMHRYDWADDILALARIDRSWLGEVHQPSDIIGQVTEDAAAHTGLRADTPVVAGSADHVASAFSAGLRQQGDLLVKLGGAGDILYVLDELAPDPRLFIDYHVVPGQYLLNGCMAASGSVIKWFRTTFAPDLDYPDLDAEGEQVPPGSDGLILLPYFLGEKTPINDPLARGIFFGLTLGHTRAHMYRAILEGIAYGFMHHLEVMAERGHRPGRTMVTNGGARSRLWKQVTADVLGLRLHQIAEHPGSSLGAAFIAGMGVGLFDDWAEIERYITIAEVTEPHMEHHRRYQDLFRIYREIYERVKDLFPHLHEIAKGQ